MSPEIFWQITPWQLSVYLEADYKRQTMAHDNNAWLAWTTANLQRLKKMPDLKKLLSSALSTKDKKEVKATGANAIIAQLKARQAIRDKEREKDGNSSQINS